MHKPPNETESHSENGYRLPARQFDLTEKVAILILTGETPR